MSDTHHSLCAGEIEYTLHGSSSEDTEMGVAGDFVIPVLKCVPNSFKNDFRFREKEE